MPDESPFAFDATGFLYNPQLRGLVGHDLAPDVLAVVEAFAAINQAAKLNRWALERWAVRHGLSEARLQVLLVLRRQPNGMRLVNLAATLEVAPPSLTGLIDSLEKDGLVRRVPDPGDRRSMLATLTATGRERVDEIWSTQVEHQVGITDGITTEELVQLRHLCLRLVENVKRATTRNGPGAAAQNRPKADRGDHSDQERQDRPGRRAVPSRDR
ncbi:MarR family transcriptional regulator [Sphaerisporangium rubeum]|uniref:DNA-binding MarR family transcriptional regulator n=1 Tax=Sphaerisporangium rubeum TaxID=321317 RepID=A0A7X0IGR1_9ACTN|nr:MarR family transcriptional regulator [Sphaerisporangium rubeum]MBB6474930.1 DNA-binding MarR family transcriptional regulator [Sphaerisporangium rubeum]